MGGKLWSWRYLILRRFTQLGVLALFAGTYHQAWQLAGRPILRGNLSAAELLNGIVDMSIPVVYIASQTYIS